MKNLSFKEALALLDICPMAMLLVGQDNNIHGCNQAFTALTGESAGTLDTDTQQPLLAPLLEEAAIINWVMPDGDERWLAVETVAVGDADVIARFYLDVTEKLRLKEERNALAAKLGEQSLRDKLLPGLLSRHGILVSMEPLVARCRRYNSPLSIIAMSIEKGQEHDTILLKLSFLLKDQTRWADLVGCNSAHDFIIVLQETTRDSALQLVEKLAARLATMSEAAAEPIIASYGIAQCANNDDAASLLERAESAMAEARTSESRTSIAM
jgi:diguanylate cyclase (GGDEF)-like protein